MKIALIIIGVAILMALFYFFVPIKDSPLSGGPVSPENPPHDPPKIPLHEYYKLKKGLENGTIIE